ncbi:MAG: AAA family ATPase [Bacteroidota bacterium]
MDLFRNIIDDLLGRDGYELTDDQEAAVDTFLRYHRDPDPSAVMLLCGAAGSGKTFLIRLFTRFLLRQGYKVALLAPTGRAAKVITRRTGRYASTLHRYIYSPIETPGGSLLFDLKPNKDPERIYYIVDEASMVGDGSGEGDSGLLADFLRFAFDEYDGRRIIMVGDPAQLPPVGSHVSPALDPAYLKATFHLSVYRLEMTQVMRQEEASEILRVAGLVRGSMVRAQPPVIDLAYGGEVELVDNGYEALEMFIGLYREDDPDAVIFITYSNKLAIEVNRALRHQLHDGVEEAIIPGDILMVVRNNYAWGNKQIPFLANGEMGIVREVYPETYEKRFGLRWMDVLVEFLDVSQNPVELECKITLELLDNKKAQLAYGDMQLVMRERRREYESLPKTRREAGMRSDPYLNALQVKYGYAVTGHKSQGGQWRNVIVGFEPLYPGMALQDYLRWAYTSLTRAEERLYLLNFPFRQDDF